MRSLRRSPPIKRASRIRSVGRMRIDAAAELLRLEYEKARLSALRGRLAIGLGRADEDLERAKARVAWVLDLLDSEGPPARRAPVSESAEQRIALALELLGGKAGTSR